MKVIGITGSPRKDGNTARLVSQVLAGAGEKGAETVHFNLNSLNIKGCQSCYYCKTHENCILNDDMQQIYKAIRSADAVVFGSPVYMDQVFAQAKIFLDRLYALMNKDRTPKLTTNPGMVLAITQANPNLEAYKPYFETLETRMERFGFALKGTLFAGGTHDKADIDGQTDLMDRAKAAGAAL